MRYKSQHLLPRQVESSRKEYKIREVDYTNDLRSRTYISGDEFDVSSQDSDVVAIGYSDDGTHFYALGNDTNTLYQYSLCPYFQINSANLDSSLPFGLYTTRPKDFVFKDNGSTLAIVDEFGTIYQFTLLTPWELSSASYDQTISNYLTTDVTSVTVNDASDYIVTTSTGLIYNITTPVSDTPYDMSSGVTLTGTGSAFGDTRGGMQFLLGGKYLFTIQEYYAGSYFQGVMYYLDIPYKISTANVSSSNGVPYGSWISPNGVNLITTGTTPKHYILSPPYNLTGMTLHCTSDVMSPAIMSVCFNPSGSRAYYLAGGNLVVANLSQAWKLSTGSVVNSYAYPAATNATIKVSAMGDYLYLTSDYHTVEQWYFTDIPYGEELVSQGEINLAGGSSQFAHWDMREDGSQYIGKTAINPTFWYYDVGNLSIGEENTVPTGTSLNSPGYSQNGSTIYTLDTSNGDIQAYFMSTNYDPSNMEETYSTNVSGATSMTVGSSGDLAYYDTTTGIVYQVRIG